MTSPHAPYGADPRAVYPTPDGALIVSTTGSDTTGTGTLASPYRTIKHAVSKVAAGGTVAIRGGEYHEGGNYPTHVEGAIFVTVDKPGVTIQNYGGEEVWLDGSQVVTGWQPYDGSKFRAPFVRDADRTPTQARGSDSSSYGTYLLPEFPIAHWPEMVLIDGVKQTQVKTLAEVGPGKFFVEGSYPNTSGVEKFAFRSSHYVLGTNPAGKEVRIGAISRAITNAADRTTFRGFGVRRYPSSLADFGAVYANQRGNITFENITVEDISDCGLDSNGPNLVIRKSTFTGCGRQGIASGIHGDNGMVEWCYIERTNDRRFNYGPIGGAFKAGRCWDFTFRYNRLHDNRGHGIWFDECAYNARIHGNYLTDTYGIGVVYEISARAWIVDNVFVNNGVLSTDTVRQHPHDGPAINILGSSNCQIWNNTFIVPEVGVYFSEGYRKPLNEDGASWRTSHPMGSVFGQDKTRGDTFYQERGYADTWDFYRKEMTWTTSGVVMANNVFAGAAGIHSVQSCFIKYHCEDGSKSAVGMTGKLDKPNVYARLDGATPQRFANSIKVSSTPYTASPTVAYFNLTGTGHEGSPSWRDTMGDTSSVLVSAPIALGREGVLARSMLANYPTAPIPAEVQALRTGSPFRLGAHGAGDPGSPPPEVRNVVAIWYGAKAILTA